MAIPESNFGLTAVRDEFAINTRPANHTLATFHTAVFGNAGVGSKLSDFAGLAQPNVLTGTESNVAEAQFQANGDVNTNDLEGFWYVEYEEVDQGDKLNSDMENGLNYSDSANIMQVDGGTITTSTLTGVSKLIDGLDEGGYFIFRISCYNPFNDGDPDDHTRGNTSDEIFVEAKRMATPIVSNQSYFSGQVSFDLEQGDYSYLSSFTAQHSWDGGSTWETGNLSMDSSPSVSGDTATYTGNNYDTLVRTPPSSTLIVRIRANSNTYQDSFWTDVYNGSV